jgi:uncharacterized protein (TIGR03086 family)
LDVAELHARSCQDFAALVATIGPEQWDAPTPCSEWDVRGLVGHVVSEDLWTVPLFEGRTIAEVGDRFDGDVLGDDPAAVCRSAAEEAVAAVSEPGALERTVHLSFGDTPAEEYAWQLFADHLIHGWDLAVSIGAGTRLDPDLVTACTSWFAANEELYRTAGVIGPRADTAVGEDPQTELLAAFGRVDATAP